MEKNECKKYFLDAEHITVTKIIKTVEENSRGEIFTTYDAYYVCDIDLKEGNEFIEDYKDAMKGETFDVKKVQPIEFYKAFDFKCSKKNAWDFYKEFLAQHNLSLESNEVVLEEEIYAGRRQKWNKIKTDESLWDDMLGRLFYEKIIDRYAAVQMVEINSGVKYPERIAVVLKYADAGWTITRNMLLEISINRMGEKV